jgi:hypothetical protein
MGDVIDLAERRARSRPGSIEAIRRLEMAVARLDPAVADLAAPDGVIDSRIETELLAITGAVTMGATEDAVQRAERLADRLEHPSTRETTDR